MKPASVRELADTFTFLANKAFLRAELLPADDRARNACTSRGLAYRVAADLVNDLLQREATTYAAMRSWWVNEQISNQDEIA